MENELIKTTPTPATLLQLAIEKGGVDITQLKELMDLQERWEKKEAKKSFLDALSKFQTLVPVIKKSKTATIIPKNGGNNFHYKYSDLGTITQQIKSAMNDCGLSYRWEFEETNEKMKVTCLVSHRDGHTETTSMEGGKDGTGFKNDIQQKGSTHTYLQRYTLIGALGLSTADQDNDGGNTGRQTKNEVSEEEIMDQWKTTINQAKNRVELQNLYLKNKKVVERNEKVQALFKQKEADLKESETANTKQPVLP